MAIVPAAANALAVLRYLTHQAGPVPAGWISRDLGLPRSTTYHLLDTLVADGFVMHLPEERRYGLGLSSYELASGYNRQAPLQRVARLPFLELVERTGFNAHLAVQHGREVIYVIEERAPGRPPLVTDVGVRLPAHLTASGRALLAALPREQVRALFPDPSTLMLRTEVGPSSLSALRQLLVETRRRGLAEEAGEVTTGYSSVAVAVLDHAGHPVAAVAVTYAAGAGDPAVNGSPSPNERLAGEVRRTALQLRRRLGGAT